MILTVIIFKNKKAECFTTPQFVDVEPENAAVQLARSLMVNEDEDVDKRYRYLDMYTIGSFNDETGDFTACKARKLLECNAVIKKRGKKEGSKHE